jgi:hypothetical protein
MSDVRSRRLALISMVALVAGCSGGGGPAAAPPAPARSSPAQPSSAHKVTVSIEFTTGAPSGKGALRSRGRRRPDYISPATLGAVVTATSTDQPANDATYGYDISLNDPNCTNNALGGTVTCTLSIPLAIDTYTVELDTYDQDDSGPPADLGTELSTDTESEAVTATPTADVFTFDPHAFVAGFAFYFFPQSSEGEVRVPPRATVRRPQALESPVGAITQGATGGATASYFNDAAALDRDGYAIDTYPGVTTFANGIFSVNVAEPGDTTGCAAATPCMSVVNALGTSYGPEVPAPTPSPATIPLPVPSDEGLTMQYSGGGSYGAGVVDWPTPVPSTSPSPVAPTGTQPYFADISLPDPSGGTIAPYLVPHTYVAPLFAYASMGAGTPFVGPATGENVYVWAAQALIPSGAASDGSSYVASFSDSPSTTSCLAGQEDWATIAGQTYYPGYGTVFTIETFENPGSGTVDCTLIVGDGVGDTQTVTIPVATFDIEAKPANRGQVTRHPAALQPGAGR